MMLGRVALAVSLVVSLAACNGFSEDKAIAFCESDRTAWGTGSCYDDAVFEQCVETHQDCGDEVLIDEDGCAPVYSCE
jgi:hypothetical protein